MIPIDEAFRRLGASRFRGGFALRGRELAYLQTWGIAYVLRQAEQIFRERVAPANPRNDGRQTPWRNHPAFVAQHATATCCRGCLEKTHEIGKGASLTDQEVAYVIRVVGRWLESELGRNGPRRA